MTGGRGRMILIDQSVSIHLPYRGTFSQPRPHALDSLALPPEPMPSRQGLRPLKAWRYVAAFTPELMLCACLARIGPAASRNSPRARSNSALPNRTGPARGGFKLAGVRPYRE